MRWNALEWKKRGGLGRVAWHDPNLRVADQFAFSSSVTSKQSISTYHIARRWLDSTPSCRSNMALQVDKNLSVSRNGNEHGRGSSCLWRNKKECFAQIACLPPLYSCQYPLWHDLKSTNPLQRRHPDKMHNATYFAWERGYCRAMA